MENMKKIQICTKVQYDSLREECSPMFNKLGAGPNCTLVPDISIGTVCSEPAATVSEASTALDLKLVEMGKTVKGLKQNPAEGKIVRFCSLIHAGRVDRWVVTGEGTSRETLPLLHREKHEVCGESETLEGAKIDGQQKSIRFATTYSYLRYRDPALQKIAETEVEALAEKKWKAWENRNPISHGVRSNFY